LTDSLPGRHLAGQVHSDEAKMSAGSCNAAAAAGWLPELSMQCPSGYIWEPSSPLQPEGVLLMAAHSAPSLQVAE